MGDKQWTGDGEEAVWAVQITEQVKAKIRERKFPRYKIVVQTVLGQQKGQGLRIASRCLWDVETDNVATYHYSNDTLWVTVMAFGIYTE